jgi:hypothetical protein
MYEFAKSQARGTSLPGFLVNTLRRNHEFARLLHRGMCHPHSPGVIITQFGSCLEASDSESHIFDDNIFIHKFPEVNLRSYAHTPGMIFSAPV